ncbi:hypothetical protein JKF63_02879 [Porcisia hertigi]|uniref:Uncharacterized protein n=1 Tax=Porcisia hertigi TaxID=2761500 RepID=A0A836LFV1_9TRYP|nr:hypothetical protein JKF63_02879 [Porcisia hertigi]
MRFFCDRKSLCHTLALALFLLCCGLVAPLTLVHADPIAVAGRVDVRREVAQYVVVRVVDDRTGVVVRSAPLDSSRSFSFANIPSPAVSVEATVDLPDHLFELDTSASVLRSAVSTSSSITPVQLKVFTISKAGGVMQETATPAAASSFASAVFALVVLMAAWYARHSVVRVLDMISLKLPKQRKAIVVM